MKGKRNCFMVSHEWYEPLAAMTDGDRGRLLLALMDYSMAGKMPELKGRAGTAFDFIRRAIDRDALAYKEKCRKRAENGRKGGNQKQVNRTNAALAAQNLANLANATFATKNLANVANPNLNPNLNPNPNPSPSPKPNPKPNPSPKPNPKPNPTGGGRPRSVPSERDYEEGWEDFGL